MFVVIRLIIQTHTSLLRWRLNLTLQISQGSASISKETKVLVYRSLHVVQSILLYNAETWTLKEENTRSLRVFEMAIVRKILECSRRDHRCNTDMMKDLTLDNDIVKVCPTTFLKNICMYMYICKVVRTRHLSYLVMFGWTARDIPTCYFTGTYTATLREESQKRDGWTM